MRWTVDKKALYSRAHVPPRHFTADFLARREAVPRGGLYGHLEAVLPQRILNLKECACALEHMHCGDLTSPIVWTPFKAKRAVRTAILVARQAVLFV
jgi:hypothetical protein